MKTVLPLLLSVLCVAAWAADGAPPVAAGATPAATATARPVTIAMLDVESRLPGGPQLGGDIAETLAGLLGDLPGYRFVERATLAQILREHELALSGVVEAPTAVTVGKLAGADLLISGKAFTLGKQVLLSLKVVGTETGLVEAVLVEDAAGGDLAALVRSAAAKLTQTLRDKGRTLLARAVPSADPLPALAARFAKLAPVTIAVAISEKHIAAARVPDPAVETEIKQLAIACGVRVQDVPANVLASLMKGGDKDGWPTAPDGVDYLIVGEGFSAGGPVLGDLRVCLARAEVNLIQRNDGAVVVADRANTRAVDLTEANAGKKALQSAGRELGLRLLGALADRLPPRPAAP